MFNNNFDDNNTFPMFPSGCFIIGQTGPTGPTGPAV